MKAGYLETVWSWMEGIIIFTGDVQTTSIAIAITTSVTCSLVILVVSLLTEDKSKRRYHLIDVVKQVLAQRRKKKKEEENRGNDSDGEGRVEGVEGVEAEGGAPASPEHPSAVAAFHLQSGKLCCMPRSSNGTVSYKSLWSDRKIEDKLCSVMCVRCSQVEAAKQCRYLLCDNCCSSSRVIPVCQQHSSRMSHSRICHQIRINAQASEEEEKPVAVNWSGLALVKCPERMGFLGSQLSLLNLSSNKLEQLPQELGCLRGLTELYIQDNLIKTLPGSIGNLRHLVKLDTCNNQIEKLPYAIGYLSNVEVILMGRNHLTELPDSIGQLTQLKKFNIAYNKLESLNEHVCLLSKLVQFDAHENPLVELPDKMDLLVRLECLNVSHCNLRSLPNSLCRCSALRWLHLSHNKIMLLPGQIGRLHQLQGLQVDHNELCYLPASVSCLGRLQTLSCVGNNLLEEHDITRRRREAPTGSVGDFTAPPSLLEISARAVALNGVTWRDQNIPRHLEEMLSKTRFCSCCEGPFCEYFKSELRFVTLSSLGLRLPLYQQICSPHLRYRCRLIPLDQQ